MNNKPKIQIVGVRPNSLVQRVLAEHFQITDNAKVVVVFKREEPPELPRLTDELVKSIVKKIKIPEMKEPKPFPLHTVKRLR